MKAEIARANCAEMYDLDEIDIESDPELLARYRNDIPIVTIDGVEVFRHRLSSYVFKAYIAASAFRQ